MNQHDLSGYDPPIVYEHDRPVVSGTAVSIYAILDGLNAGTTPARIQRTLGVNTRTMETIMAYLDHNRSMLDHAYQKEITQFTQDLLTRLEGVHQPSWKERSYILGGLLLLLLFGYLTNLLASDGHVLFLVFFVFVDAFFLCTVVLASIALFRRTITFRSPQLTVVNFQKRQSFILPYQDIARLFVVCGRLVVTARDGTTYYIHLTQSIKTTLDDMFEKSRYDGWLHVHCQRGF